MRAGLFRTAEDVYKIKLLRDLGETGKSFLSQDFALVRIDWNDSVALLLHIPGHAVARANGIGRKADDCDRPAFIQNFLDRFGTVDRHALKFSDANGFCGYGLIGATCLLQG